MQDAEYGPPSALLDAGLAHEHDQVLRGGDLDEDLPSDLLDSALLDDGHVGPWARAGLVLHEDPATGDEPHADMLGHAGTPAAADDVGVPDAAAAAAPVAAGPQHPQLQDERPRVSSLDNTADQGDLSSFPAADTHDRIIMEADGTAAAPAVQGMVPTLQTAPKGVEAEVEAQAASPSGGTAAHTTATSAADTSTLVPSCNGAFESCAGVPAGLPVDHGSHVSRRASSSSNSLDSASDVPDISDVPAPSEVTRQQPTPLGQTSSAGEQQMCAERGSTGGAISSSDPGDSACAAPEASHAAQGTAATTGGAAAAGGPMFASACSSWHTCVSASSSGSAMWRSMGPAGSSISISSSVGGLKQPALPAGRLPGPAATSRGPAAAPTAAPDAAGEAAAPGLSSRDTSMPQCPATASQGLVAAPGGHMSVMQAPHLPQQQQQPAAEEEPTRIDPGMVPTSSSSVALANSSKQEVPSVASPSVSSVGGAHLHHLLPYPQPASVQAAASPASPEAAVPASSGFQLPARPSGSGASAAGGAGGYPPGHMPVSMAGYPLASMVMRESQLEDVSLSMSLARDPWAQHPAHSMAPPLPPAAARAVQAAALALTESSYSPAASAQRSTSGGGDASAGGRGGARAAGGSMGARGARPRAASLPAATTAGAGGWLPRQPLWGVPGALQHLGQQAAAAACGVMSSAASVARRPSAATPTTSTGPGRAGQRPVGGVAGVTGSEEEPVLVSPSGTPRASGSSSGGASGVEFEEERGMVVVQHSPDMPQSLEEMEAEQFRGLLYADGRDSHGRPVLVVDVDRIPAGQQGAPREAALSYLLRQATPLVCQGAYVLVLVASAAGPPFGLLPSWWCLRTYRSLSRPFKKHVRFVVLVQPNMFVRAILTLLTPFLSPKAHTKIKQVDHLLDIDAATRGELQVAHLGESFLSAVQRLPTLAGPR